MSIEFEQASTLSNIKNIAEIAWWEKHKGNTLYCHLAARIMYDFMLNITTPYLPSEENPDSKIMTTEGKRIETSDDYITTLGFFWSEKDPLEPPTFTRFLKIEWGNGSWKLKVENNGHLPLINISHLDQEINFSPIVISVN